MIYTVILASLFIKTSKFIYSRACTGISLLPYSLSFFCGFIKLKTGFLNVIYHSVLYETSKYRLLVVALKLIRHFARGGDGRDLRDPLGYFNWTVYESANQVSPPVGQYWFSHRPSKIQFYPVALALSTPSSLTNRESKISGRLAPDETDTRDT